MWRRIVLCNLGLALCVAPAAFGDPVALSGSISVNTLEGPAFNLSADGFHVFGVVGTPPSLDFSQVADFYIYCGAHNGPAGSCRPGQFIQLAGGTVGEAFLGNADVTVDGVPYSNAQVFLNGNFVADSMEVPAAPAGQFQSVTVSAPFTFFGTLRASLNGADLFSADAAGTGMANALLIWSGDPELGFFDEDQDITYVFSSPGAQTPEPASLLLLGTGAAWLCGQTKKARHSK